jgi:hypothetical protein
MNKNTKQALLKAKRRLKTSLALSGAVSYIVVASFALVVVSRDGSTYGGQFDNQWEGGINDHIKLCSYYSGGTCFGGSCRNGGWSSIGFVF